MTAAVVVLVTGAVLSLAGSTVLVTRIERLGERFRLTEAMLGLVAALAADAPEITSAAGALARGQRAVGVGVVLGSNAFNLAALLGIGAVISGRIALHRRVVTLEGAVALWMAGVSICALTGLIGPITGLVCVLAVLAPYAWLSAVHARGSGPVSRWLTEAIAEEEQEVRAALHPGGGRPRDSVSALSAGVALVVVVAASLAMERAATDLGTRLAVPGIVTGAIVLAAVTSLPNAVAAVHLARRGRGAATLSEAMNSNTLNVAFGLFVPAAITGLTAGGGSTLVAAWYAGMTAGVLGLAWHGGGLTRRNGAAVITAYAAFVVVLVLR